MENHRAPSKNLGRRWEKRREPSKNPRNAMETLFEEQVYYSDFLAATMDARKQLRQELRRTVSARFRPFRAVFAWFYEAFGGFSVGFEPRNHGRRRCSAPFTAWMPMAPAPLAPTICGKSSGRPSRGRHGMAMVFAGYILFFLVFFSPFLSFSLVYCYCLASLAVWCLLWLFGFCGFLVAPVPFWLFWLLWLRFRSFFVYPSASLKRPGVRLESK